MKPDLMAPLTRTQLEAVESAGYRVMRWLAAREVLQSRVTKSRIAGALGGFLTHWLALAPAPQAGEDLSLSFVHAPDQMLLQLAGGGATLALAPLEQALLHLPALRPFWSQELRQQHFEALRDLVPQAWLMDPIEVPPGAVIQGLGTVSWQQTQRREGQKWEIHDPKGSAPRDWPLALASRDCILTARTPAGIKLNALYGRNDKGQVVLRSLEAAP
ncbi:MAG: hypothetical protein B7Z37_13340 [Verrucomicrobia bacterium 12-59-8]|nr:MAG: hypothetical protein B7Z37_13340 [Verrucomicrobia bacterium 12-59-8]